MERWDGPLSGYKATFLFVAHHIFDSTWVVVLDLNICGILMDLGCHYTSSACLHVIILNSELSRCLFFWILQAVLITTDSCIKSEWIQQRTTSKCMWSKQQLIFYSWSYTWKRIDYYYKWCFDNFADSEYEWTNKDFDWEWTRLVVSEHGVYYYRICSIKCRFRLFTVIELSLHLQQCWKK